MFDKDEAEHLDRSWTMIRTIWGALVGSLAVYLLAGNVIETRLRPVDVGFPVETMRTVLFCLAIATIVATSYIRKALLKIPSAGPSSLFPRSPVQIQHPAAIKYLQAIVVAMALSESLAVYGLVLFFLSRDASTLYLFIGMAALAMFYYRPVKEELLQLAEEMERTQH